MKITLDYDQVIDRLSKGMARTVATAALLAGCSAGIGDASGGADPTLGSADVGAEEDGQLSNAVPELVEGKLAFADTASFYSMLDAVARMDEAELAEWEETYDFPSYRRLLEGAGRDESIVLSEVDQEFERFPSNYLTLLNRDGEVQIGEDVVWYDRGVRHFVPADDDALLRAIKLDPSKSERTGSYSLSKLSVAAEAEAGESLPEGGATTGLRPLTLFNVLGGLDAHNQQTFNYLGKSDSVRKYVHELVVFTDGAQPFNDPFFGPGYRYHSTLYLRMKLEWLGRRGWNPAGEERTISYALTTNSQITNIHVPPIVITSNSSPVIQQSWSGSETRRSSLDLLIDEVDALQFTGTNGGDPLFSVTVNGSISQHITGDLPENAWTNEGTLWE